MTNLKRLLKRQFYNSYQRDREIVGNRELRKVTMDQFDKALKNIAKPSVEVGPANILIVGTAMNTIEAIRAALEIQGHAVSYARTVAEYEELACSESFGVVFVTTETKNISTELLFESVSLINPNTIVIGYSANADHSSAIQFIRNGGSDHFCIPEDLDCVGTRIQTLLVNQQNIVSIKNSANNALRLCDKMNRERHRVEEENNSLNDKLAHTHCVEQKKMQQVAIGAEFQTLVSQELDVESMLRTALGYVLTRVGAMNAAVYLREGVMDWGIGAFINYDRQSEHFQSLIDTMGPIVCPAISSDEQIKHVVNGEAFANAAGLDSTEFSGNEVVSFGCFSDDRCMAVIVLFREDSRSFTPEAITTLETIRTIFGQQLGTILKIHRRAESQWPSESIDDDDWSIDKAA